MYLSHKYDIACLVQSGQPNLLQGSANMWPVSLYGQQPPESQEVADLGQGAYRLEACGSMDLLGAGIKM